MMSSFSLLPYKQDRETSFITFLLILILNAEADISSSILYSVENSETCVKNLHLCYEGLESLHLDCVSQL